MATRKTTIKDLAGEVAYLTRALKAPTLAPSHAHAATTQHVPTNRWVAG